MLKQGTRLGLLLALSVTCACSRKEPPPANEQPADALVGAERGKVTATANIKPTEGNQAQGQLTLTQESDGVRIRGTISGLQKDSTHGFHVHEKGDCSAPDAKSAGEHFNPAHAPHGKAESGEHHLGDIDNLKAGPQGDATVNVLISGAKLSDGSPSDLIGKSFIVHAGPDDYKTQPSGNSGPRIACGVITKQ